MKLIPNYKQLYAANDDLDKLFPEYAVTFNPIARDPLFKIYLKATKKPKFYSNIFVYMFLSIKISLKNLFLKR